MFDIFSFGHCIFEPVDLVEVCLPQNYNVGLLAYSPLAGGSLTGKYLNPEACTSGRFNLFPGYMGRYNKSLARVSSSFFILLFIILYSFCFWFILLAECCIFSLKFLPCILFHGPSFQDGFGEFFELGNYSWQKKRLMTKEYIMKVHDVLDIVRGFWSQWCADEVHCRD